MTSLPVVSASGKLHCGMIPSSRPGYVEAMFCCWIEPPEHPSPIV